MEPMETVTFDGPPEEWVALHASYADMGMALDIKTKDLQAHTPRLYFDTQLPVEYDPDAECPEFKAFIDEIVYDEDPRPLHGSKPATQLVRLGRPRHREINENVAPFFGNIILRRRRLARLQRTTRCTRPSRRLRRCSTASRLPAFASFHEEFMTDFQERLPETTPEAALLYPADQTPETFDLDQVYDRMSE